MGKQKSIHAIRRDMGQVTCKSLSLVSEEPLEPDERIELTISFRSWRDGAIRAVSDSRLSQEVYQHVTPVYLSSRAVSIMADICQAVDPRQVPQLIRSLVENSKDDHVAHIIVTLGDGGIKCYIIVQHRGQVWEVMYVSCNRRDWTPKTTVVTGSPYTRTGAD